MRSSLIALAILASASIANATLITVDDAADAFVPVIDGYEGSVTRDQTTIRAAIQAASTTGDTVYVHSGTYTERVIAGDWAADDVVLIVNPTGGDVGWTNSTATGQIATSSTYSGTKLLNVTFTGVSNGIGLTLSDETLSVEVDSCTWNGESELWVYCPAGADANDVTFNFCSFSSTVAYVTLGYMWTRSFINDVTFNDCTFDLSNVTMTSGSYVSYKLVGAHGWEFNHCYFYGPQFNSSGSYSGLAFEGSAGYTQGDILLLNCVWEMAAPGSTGGGTQVHFGRSSGVAAATVDSVRVEGCIFNGPGTELVNALKFESVAASDFSDHCSVTGNVFRGYHIAVGVLEGSLGVIVSKNRIFGTLDTTNNDIGIYFQDARQSEASNNWISNCDRGIQWANGSDTRNNFGNRAIANYIEGCTNAFYPSATLTDSASVRAGNVIASSNTRIAAGAYGNITTIAAWQAAAVPSLPVYLMNGQGDVLAFPGDIDARLRVTAGVPPSKRVGITSRGLRVGQ